MRTGSTSAKMGRLVERWHQSGESQAGFARRHRVPTWTFWYWCRKLSTVTPPSKDVFVPVRVTTEDTAPVVEVVFTSGDRLQVRPGATPELLQAMIMALRARC